MKHKQYETPHGIIKYKQYGYPDVIPKSVINTLTSEQVFGHITKSVVKGNVKKARERTGRYLYRLMWKLIVDATMEGDVFEVPYGGKIFIGPVEKLSKKHVNFNTNGAIYNIKLQLPQSHTYRLRMPYRRRSELKMRLNKGQHFINY